MNDSNKEQLAAKLEITKRGLELIVQESKRIQELVYHNDVDPYYALPLLVDYIVATHSKVEKTNEFLGKEKNPKA
ncbi:hypothetical protein SY212_03450 [Ligilactobacillus agilis]|uniref:Uncharacterized protein n=1 Tax=Ligilactobacillus agilis TaxID=1601 RepID=A0A6F9XJD6_9LACO|nr:hypothetical protein [Ligilactobacillus agilis]GET05315.1 hypothetical protein SY212_03450 [Ligilactobacillus agilis]